MEFNLILKKQHKRNMFNYKPTRYNKPSKSQLLLNYKQVTKIVRFNKSNLYPIVGKQTYLIKECFDLQLKNHKILPKTDLIRLL